MIGVVMLQFIVNDMDGISNPPKHEGKNEKKNIKKKEKVK